MKQLNFLGVCDNCIFIITCSYLRFAVSELRSTLKLCAKKTNAEHFIHLYEFCKSNVAVKHKARLADVCSSKTLDGMTPWLRYLQEVKGARMVWVVKRAYIAAFHSQGETVMWHSHNIKKMSR